MTTRVRSEFGERYASLVEEARELRNLLEWLIDELPKCDACGRPATRAHGRGGARYCDRHGDDTTPDYPRAEPLRASLRYLHGLGPEDDL